VTSDKEQRRCVWIVREQAGRYGGIFATQKAAVRFALEQRRRQGQQVVCIYDLPKVDCDQVFAADPA
jgi:hypothetical protein